MSPTPVRLFGQLDVPVAETLDDTQACVGAALFDLPGALLGVPRGAVLGLSTDRTSGHYVAPDGTISDIRPQFDAAPPAGHAYRRHGVWIDISGGAPVATALVERYALVPAQLSGGATFRPAEFVVVSAQP